MVKLADVAASNARIATELPAGLVAVFAGGTSGIGEYSVLAFAKHARQPKVYIVGRSQSAADRIMAECKRLNPEGQYAFIQVDASLLSNVDDACRQLRAKEKAINVLYLSIGTLQRGVDTTEGLPREMALQYYARMRFITNLLPQLRAATGLRRVVNTLAGTKEGAVDLDDIECRRTSLLRARGHLVSLTTLTLEELAKSAPDVAFVHDYPGVVRSNIGRDMSRGLWLFLNVAMALLGPFIIIPNDESGERHAFLATSAMYPAREGAGANNGVALALGSRLAVARGTDGQVGSGVYTVGEACENAPLSVDETLARLRKQGVADRVWAHTVGVFERITGMARLQ